MPLPPNSRPSQAELFAHGDLFTIDVDEWMLAEDELRFDMLDSTDQWVWLPRLGPTATLMYINVLRYWQHAPSGTDSITLDIHDMAHDIGVQGHVARSAWHRLSHFRITAPTFVDDHVFVKATRWLPAHNTNQLDRMTPAWNIWYRDLCNFRRSQQGLT